MLTVTSFSFEQLRGEGFAAVAIPLSRRLWAIVDIEDAPSVLEHRWHAHVSRTSKTCYAARHIRRPDGARPILFLHNQIMGVIGIDHADRDGLNNRRLNLRRASTFQNAQNKAAHSSNTSGFKGVSFHKPLSKWRAKIHIPGGKDLHLGYFATPEEAAFAYDAAATEFQGEFAVTNSNLKRLRGIS